MHNPGSDEALEEGCICPVMDNGHGRGFGGVEKFFVYNMSCEYHREDWNERLDGKS